jgi:hypothetical protein
MKFVAQRRLFAAGLILALVVALAPAAVLAAEPRGGNDVVVGPNEVVTDDLYVGAGIAAIQGTIQGDLVITGGQVTVSGPVRGDVIAAAGTTTIQGPVGRNIRAVGGTITISNSVAQDVVVGGGNVILGPQAEVGRDILAGAGTMVIEGTVARNVTAGGGDLTLGGPIGGDVTFDGTTLRLTDRSSVGGKLAYTSNNEVVGPVTAVKGGVQRIAPTTPTRQPTYAGGLTDGVIGWARAVVGLFVLGLVSLLLFPRFSRRTIATGRKSPFATFGVGLGTLVVAPFGVLLIIVLGLIVGGWWIGILALMLYCIVLAVGLSLAVLDGGAWLLEIGGQPKAHPIWMLLLGAAVLELVALVPVVGGLACFLLLVFGIGTLVLTGYRVYQEGTNRRTLARLIDSQTALSAAGPGG